MSLMRASLVVKRQLMGAPCWLRRCCRVAASAYGGNVGDAGDPGTRRLKALSSISAMFSQLPCLGV